MTLLPRMPFGSNTVPRSVAFGPVRWLAKGTDTIPDDICDVVIRIVIQIEAANVEAWLFTDGWDGGVSSR